MKKCGRCKSVKPFDQFYNDRTHGDGKANRCIPCIREAQNTWRRENPEKFAESMRKSQIKRLYGISYDEYMEMLKSQGMKCLICSDSLDGAKHTNIDHDHDTGRVRGILCAHCNKGLGMFKDDPKLLQSAIEYLIYIPK